MELAVRPPSPSNRPKGSVDILRRRARMVGVKPEGDHGKLIATVGWDFGDTSRGGKHRAGVSGCACARFGCDAIGLGKVVIRRSFSPSFSWGDFEDCAVAGSVF